MIKNLTEKEFDKPAQPTKYKNPDVAKMVFNKMVEDFISRQNGYVYEEAKLMI